MAPVQSKTDDNHMDDDHMGKRHMDERPLVGGPGLDRSQVTGVIFCGGLSRRMGRDKALLESQGQTLLQRAQQLLEPQVASVMLSCGHTARYEHMELTCVVDLQPDLGPIGGLQASLGAAQTPWILALACDLPQVPASCVQELMLSAREGDLAVLYGSPAHPEPLLALYHQDLKPSVDAAIRAERRRMTSFLETSGDSCAQGTTGHPIRWLPLPEHAEQIFANVNHPQDWKSYQQTAAPLKADGRRGEEPTV